MVLSGSRHPSAEHKLYPVKTRSSVTSLSHSKIVPDSAAQSLGGSSVLLSLCAQFPLLLSPGQASASSAHLPHSRYDYSRLSLELKPSDALFTAFFRDFQLLGAKYTQLERACQSQCYGAPCKVSVVSHMCAMQLIGGKRESVCSWEVSLAFNNNKKIVNFSKWEYIV